MERPVSYLFGVCVLAFVSAHTVSLSAPFEPLRLESIRPVETGIPQALPVLFVGDIMLARQVEAYMDERGDDYPFRGVSNILASYPIVVGNFEGAIPEEHRETKPLEMRFSIEERSAAALFESGFTNVGLANNHAYDFGKEGFDNTVEVLRAAGLQASGRPDGVLREDVQFIDIGGMVIAVIPLHATAGVPEKRALETVLSFASDSADMEIAYVHWGEEYIEKPSKAQEAFAHSLVDMGFDAIIGHHPHVVQSIDRYRGAPIFYSLGNFIFDQYWDEAVETGLAVRLSHEGGQVRFTLLPVVSDKSTPRFATGEEKRKLLDTFARFSIGDIQESVARGVIEAETPILAEAGL